MQRQDRVFAGVLVVTILVMAAVVALSPFPQRQVGQSGILSSFSSYDEMKSYVLQGVGKYQNNVENFAGGVYKATASLALATPSAVPSLTSTNIQVEGVDEPDFVKSDGTYLYVATGNAVSVVLAYPPDKSTVVSRLQYDGQVLGIFISQNRLLVIESGARVVEGINRSVSYAQAVYFLLYDDSDTSKISLIKSISVEGTYVDSRLTGGFIYAVVQQPTYSPENASFAAPTVVDGKVAGAIEPSSVFYSTGSASSFSAYTIILGLNVTDGSHSQTAVLTGWGSTIYSSTSNIYLSFPDRMGYPVKGGVALPAIGVVQRGIPIFWGGYGGNTTIFRVSFSEGKTQVEAGGMIPGTVLNQFSLDEYQGYLRVATTSYRMLPNQTQVRVNNVYVLNQNIGVVGAVEGLAPKEHIYSVRFLGDVGYVVTFEQIDPLFVISFADPAHPAVLSSLELTGFSDYLHPIGNGYLIGVGKETVPAPQEAGYVLYLGLKFSLFHVYDNGSSVEVAKYLMGDRGSDSLVLSDHKAFVYDADRGIMALPVLVAKTSQTSSGGNLIFDYGTAVWQGAVLFEVSPQSGFQLIGNVTQIPSGSAVDQNSDYYVSRVVIVGDFVYTVSNKMVMVNSLQDMSLVAEIQL